MKKILIAGSNKPFLDFLKNELSSRCEVTLTNEKTTALQYLVYEMFELAVLLYEKEGMDTIDLAQKVQKKNQQVGIVLITHELDEITRMRMSGLNLRDLIKTGFGEKQDLIRAVQKRINEKMKLRIREKHGKIVLAGHPEELKEIHEKAKQAIMELGAQMEIEIIGEDEARRLYGVSQTPAWINIRNRIKSEGSEPGIDVMKEWIKALL